MWDSNGTALGTEIVKDINSGSADSFPQYLTNASGALLFAANNGVNGDQLWVSDGAAAGTVMVDPGSGACGPNQLTIVGNTLFFAATDPTHGTELWDLSLAPTVSITSPANNSYTNNNEPTLTTTASDNVQRPGQRAVPVQQRWRQHLEQRRCRGDNCPIQLRFYIGPCRRQLPVRTVAIDNANNSTTSTVVSFTIDTVAPTVSITSPTNSSITNNNKPTLTATASDNAGGSGLSSVQFQYSSNGGSTWSNAGEAETSGPFSYTFPTALADGSYEARAIAVEQCGQPHNVHSRVLHHRHGGPDGLYHRPGQ